MKTKIGVFDVRQTTTSYMCGRVARCNGLLSSVTFSSRAVLIKSNLCQSLNFFLPCQI